MVIRILNIRCDSIGVHRPAYQHYALLVRFTCSIVVVSKRAKLPIIYVPLSFAIFPRFVVTINPLFFILENNSCKLVKRNLNFVKFLKNILYRGQFLQLINNKLRQNPDNTIY